MNQPTPTHNPHSSHTSMLSHATEVPGCEPGNVPAGLSEADVAKIRADVGWNELQEVAPFPWWRRLLAQFQDLVIWILLVAAFVAGLMNEWTDALAIVAIVILNGLLGFFQEERAQQALAALRKLSRPQVKVVREGVLRTLPARELVPGDLIEIEAGDDVPADARLCTSFNLSVQEASLTGESVPVAKDFNVVLPLDTPLGDRRNMVYLGTVVATGKGRAWVTSIGMNTELGRIAGLLQQQEPEPTPLQKRLAELGRVLAVGCLSIVFVVFLLQWLRHGQFFESFLTSVGLAVAAVPEGLPAVVTIALALGLQRMVARNALVRKLPSVETLGSVTVICSDKTGTLTRNEMTVQAVVTATRAYSVTGSGYVPQGKFYLSQDSNEPAEVAVHEQTELKHALQIGKWCNNARLLPPETGKQAWSIVGDPTEAALLVAYEKADLDKDGKAPQVVHEIPFDSNSKHMTMRLHTPTHGERVFVKGAPEVLLGMCSREFVENEVRPLNDLRREAWSEANARLAAKALRVLAVAFRPAEANESNDQLAQNMIMVGMIGMLDPPREEARGAIAKCRQAGIQPVMITGDHPATAFAIAKALHLAQDDTAVLTGTQLEQMSDEELRQRVQQTSVYARATAEHKMRIVRAWQSHRHVVAMTGDGVNDAPAVQAADIGIAMGIAGTDVTKAAADMVLTDDNFTSIVNAVEEGRGIYDNIRKVLQFLLACNVGEILLMFFASVLGWSPPLLPIQLLWINLVTDGIPALALTLEPTEPDVMSRPPRPAQEPILSRSLGLVILAQGILVGLTSLAAYGISRYWLEDSVETARAVTFSVLVFDELLRSLAARSNRKTIFQLGWFGNPWLLGAVLACCLLQTAVMLTPVVRGIFAMPSLDWQHWLLILLLAMIPITVVEITKLVRKLMDSSTLSSSSTNSQVSLGI